MHPDVAAVMQELDAHRARFIVFCRALSAEELERPVPGSEWQVRDFIAHLATIDGPVAATFTAIQENQQEGSGDTAKPRWDVDRWNQGKVEQRRGTSVDALFAEAAEGRVNLRKVLAAFDEESLGRTLRFGGDSRRTAAEVEVRAYLRGWCKHDPMHVVDMLRGIPGRRTAIVDQWIDDPVIAAYQAQMNP
jgi:hypothetical protein